LKFANDKYNVLALQMSGSVEFKPEAGDEGAAVSKLGYTRTESGFDSGYTSAT
jgi:hypothetical protein